MNWSKYFLKALLIALWKVDCPFFIPNGITIQTKVPEFVTKVVLYLSSGAIEISLSLGYFKYPSRK
jgi:hypothetical protein